MSYKGFCRLSMGLRKAPAGVAGWDLSPVAGPQALVDQAPCGSLRGLALDPSLKP